jgi:putative membrane protein
MQPTLTADEHGRIADAIRVAEAGTSGEIYCVLAERSDLYFYPAATFASLCSLATGVAAAFALEWLWIVPRLPYFAAAQLLAVAAILLVLWVFPSIRIAFVPHGLRTARAHDNARKQFLARNIHLTARRTGVLIFVSRAERYAEVLADAGIAALVPQTAWDGIVERLLEDARAGHLANGFVAAVAEVGALLSTHFPPPDDDINELDDHLVEI